ncbi:MAG: hypothetical protein HY055_07665 [Magnetospirillum sp.]|nr:hypothetical protein [Magnetospirillum sp.]
MALTSLISKMCRDFTALALVSCVCACSGDSFVSTQRKAEYLTEQAGWSYGVISSPPFTLASAIAPSSPSSRGEILTIYLEGDGLAFLGPHTISRDPTPTDPLALRLALVHRGRPVAYLARPCQYVKAPACQPAYWTSHRYAADVVDSTSGAIDQIKVRTGARRVILVGYSSGGALAVLVAARRADVAGLVTIAANLDLDLWSRVHGLTPLSGSLDPANVAAAVAGIPQVHFVGGKDEIVPAIIARSFLAKANGQDQAHLVAAEGFGHVCCWVDDWVGMQSNHALAVIPGWPQGLYKVHN